MKISKDDMIKMLQIMDNNTGALLKLQEAYMQEQTKVYHEQWKVRYLTRRLKAINPHEAVSEEELDAMIHAKEH
jgi:hypothetical protein|tara:strand:- start:244 stop:465 length:222 start_codon:yes stop_codon:yes gene_type:complete